MLKGDSCADSMFMIDELFATIEQYIQEAGHNIPSQDRYLLKLGRERIPDLRIRVAQIGVKLGRLEDAIDARLRRHPHLPTRAC
jgi:hypothetical protein